MEPSCLSVQLTSQQFIIGQIIVLEMLQKAPTAQIQSRGPVQAACHRTHIANNLNFNPFFKPNQFKQVRYKKSRPPHRWSNKHPVHLQAELNET